MIITIFYLLSKISENYTYNIIKRRRYLLYFTRIYIILSFMFLTSDQIPAWLVAWLNSCGATECIKILLAIFLYIYFLPFINNAWLYRLLAILFFKPSRNWPRKYKIKKQKNFFLSKLLWKRFVRKETPFYRKVRSICGTRGSDNLIPLSLKIHRESIGRSSSTLTNAREKTVVRGVISSNGRQRMSKGGLWLLTFSIFLDWCTISSVKSPIVAFA